MFVILKMLLRRLVLPPAGPVLLAAAGAWLALRHPAGRARRAGIALLACGLALLWLLSLPVVAGWLARAADRTAVLDAGRAQGAQAIVILGGGGARKSAPEYGGAPAAGAQLLERLAYGAYLAHRTGLPVLVTGSYAETEAMHATLSRQFQVAPRWIESHSRDTFQNAQYSAPLLAQSGVHRVLLVTSAAHAYRAAREFEAAGFTVVPAPVGAWVPQELNLFSFVPDMDALGRSTEGLYELSGDLARRLLAASHLRRQEGAAGGG